MKQVGVVVEGPSDAMFWERLLGSRFSQDGYTFRIRIMKGGNRVIQESPDLTDDFRKAKYHSAIIILDADKSPCASGILEQFDRNFLAEARHQPPTERFAQIFVARRELESWVLADPDCIRNLLGREDYSVTSAETSAAGKAKFLRLCRASGMFLAGLEDLECARQAARHFAPERAIRNSPSFAYFWSRLVARLTPTSQ
ncbi:MAG TPA: DUF4276 family protein [Verrucomicrobiae bacterium]|nr:DUF4276 family protein [Verrucomicrobiae bacterium]